MIEYVRGKLVALAPGQAVLEVGATGIALEIPQSTESLEPQLGAEVLFYTRLLFREDDLRLIGFHAAEERDLFNLITGVSGFGPRLGLSLLGSLTVAQLCAAILGEDIKTLCLAPGVGKKMAQRLILELKDKVPRLYTPEKAALARLDPLHLEIIEALQGLGYSNMEATAAVNKVLAGSKGELTGEELLKKTLGIIAGGNRPGG